MQGLRLKPLSEMIADLDEEAKRSEEWRKAQGLPRSAYRPSLSMTAVIVAPFGKGADDEN